MKQKIRYCIHCGHKIGDEPQCTNPDCGLPNFYRNVPKPVHRATVSTPRSPAPGADGSSPAVLRATPGSGDSDRHTMPMQTAPVALLRRTSEPHEQLPLYPGMNSVGAKRSAKIVIDHAEISSQHATIECTLADDGIWSLTVADSESTNGTFVNDEAVSGDSSLQAGDRLRFASLEYEVLFVTSDEPRVTIAMPRRKERGKEGPAGHK